MEVKHNQLVTMWNGQQGRVLSVVGTKANIKLTSGKRLYADFDQIVAAVDGFTEKQARFLAAKDKLTAHNAWAYKSKKKKPKKAAFETYAPGKVDESKWKKAEEAVAKSSGKAKADFGDKEWATVNTVYQNMGGKFESKKDSSVKTAADTGDTAYDMGQILFVDAVGSVLESAYEEGEESDLAGVNEKLGYNASQQELTEYIPSMLTDAGIKMPDEEIKKVGQELIAAIDEKWEGKLTVAELVKEFPAVWSDLALVSQGHGVSPEDDTEVETFMESKGVSSHGLYLESFGDSLRDTAWSLLSDFNTQEPGVEAAKKTAGHPNDFETKYRLGDILVPVDAKQAPELDMITIKDVDLEKKVYILEKRPTADMDLDKAEPTQAYGVRYEESISKIDGDKKLTKYTSLNIEAGCPSALLRVTKLGSLVRLSFKEFDALYTSAGKFVKTTKKTAAELGTLDNNTVPVDRTPTKGLTSAPNTPAADGNIKTLEDGHPAESEKAGRADNIAIFSSKYSAIFGDLIKSTGVERLAAIVTAKRRPENQKMQEFLLSNGVDARVKYIADGSMRGTWRLQNPVMSWTPELQNKLTELGFTDFDGRPLNKYSGNGGKFSVFVRGHNEMLNTQPEAADVGESQITERELDMKLGNLDTQAARLAKKLSGLDKQAATNDDVINLFVTDSFPKDKLPTWGTPNLKISKQPDGSWALMHYATIMALRDTAGVMHVNKRKYSQSTSAVQKKITEALAANGVTEGDPIIDDSVVDIKRRSSRLAAKLRALAVGTTGPYKSDEDIAGEFSGMTVNDISIQTNNWKDAEHISGYVDLTFPEADESVAGGQEGPADISDSWIFYNFEDWKIGLGDDGDSSVNPRIAFDNWYPEKTYLEIREKILEKLIVDLQGAPNTTASRLAQKIAATDLTNGMMVEGEKEDDTIIATRRRLAKKAARLGNYDFDIHGGRNWKLEACDQGTKIKKVHKG